MHLVEAEPLGRGKAPLAELSTEEFDEVVGVNLRGAFLAMKHEISAMLESGGGAIVNTSSTAGLAGAAAGIAPYVSAKHGLQGLTKIAALDYAEHGVRVNTVAPGPILTGLLARIGEDGRRMAAQAVPMRRLGQPEEVAAAAVWLCSDEAAFITGATLAIDGGNSPASPEKKRAKGADHDRLERQPAGRVGTKAVGAITTLAAATFLVGALLHAGVEVPIEVATLAEPRLIPAVIVEGLCAVALSTGAYGLLAGRRWGPRAARAASVVGVAGS